MLDVEIQQVVPLVQNEPFHEVKVSVIPEPTQQPPSTPPLPATEDPTAPIINFEVVDSFLYKFHALEKDIQELKQADHSTAILESIRSQVPLAVKEYLGTSFPYAFQKVVSDFATPVIQSTIKETLEQTPVVSAQSSSQPQSSYAATESIIKFELKKILIEKMKRSQSNHEKDKDEDPSAGPNQGKVTKNGRTRKEGKFSKKSSTLKESTKGKPPSKSSKTGKSASVDQSVKEPEHDPDWFTQPPRPKTPDPEWNTVKTIDDTPEQSWFNKMVPAVKPPLTFDKLMSTPIDFLAFAINRLHINNITREVLVGPVFNLLKAAKYTMEGIEDLISNLWSLVIVDYEKDAVLRIKHWRSKRQLFYRVMINMVSKHKVFSTMRILSVVSVQVEKKHGYGYLKKIIIRRADQSLYKFKEGNFLDLHLNDIEDMLLLIAQNKLFTLDGNVIVDFVTTLKMFTRGMVLKNRVEDVQLGVESYQRKLNLTKPQRSCPGMSAKELYTSNYDPQGVIYGDKKKRKRLMRVDEIHKEWTEKDQKRTRYVLRKIDDELLKRIIMRSLEVLVGGRNTETDIRLLQRIV
ncbi:hypothetical protein Tco_1219527 [Tanacetum coccineum]